MRTNFERAGGLKLSEVFGRSQSTCFPERRPSILIGRELRPHFIPHRSRGFLRFLKPPHWGPSTRIILPTVQHEGRLHFKKDCFLQRTHTGHPRTHLPPPKKNNCFLQQLQQFPTWGNAIPIQNGQPSKPVDGVQNFFNLR